MQTGRILVGELNKKQTASRKISFRLGEGGYKWGVGGIVKDGKVECMKLKGN